MGGGVRSEGRRRLLCATSRRFSWETFQRTTGLSHRRGYGWASCHWRPVTKTGWALSQAHVEGVPTPGREGRKVPTNPGDLWVFGNWTEMQAARMVLGAQRRRQEERLGKPKPLEVFKASQSLLSPAPTPNWQFGRAHTRMSRQAAFSRVIWSAMVKLVKPGRRLANSTILIMHLVASSLNLSQRPRSSRTRWSALEF